jgi:serine/threonine-protein kinase RsbW
MDADYDVQLIVPAEPGSARLARLVAAALAADANFTIDDTEDLRVAVSELVALLVEGAEDPGAKVSLSYRRNSTAVEVSGARELAPSENRAATDGATPDDLALEILRVVVDEHHFETNESGRQFRLLKRARPG